MTREELAAWLRLLETPGIGRTRARELLRALGSPQEVLDAPRAAWRDLLPEAVARALSEPPPGLDLLVERTWRWLQEPDRHLLALGDEAYPAAWLKTDDPPLLVHAAGRLALLRQPSVAIVGSRQATAQGLEMAREFAADLARAGWGVVSGLAQGIDAAAHEGALAVGGDTVAIVGTGLDRVYPRQHHALAARIAREGLLVSEHVLGTPALAPHFPQRNRLIAGLADGTLVVEAALKSGSLITARLAAEAGREVFAIPGSIRNPQAQGCHRLIRDGATLVESAEDLLAELPRQPQGAPRGQPAADAPRDDPDDPLLAHLAGGALDLDDLQARTGMPTAELSVRLLELELDGRLERLPGPRFRRLDRT